MPNPPTETSLPITENDLLAEISSRAAAAIRTYPMTYGARGVPFFAVLDTINIMYGLAYGASFVEVWREGEKKPFKSTRAACDEDFIRGRAKHQVSIPAPNGSHTKSATYVMKVGLLDEDDDGFEDRPNLLSHMLGRRGICNIVAKALAEYDVHGAGTLRRGPRLVFNEPADLALYRELDWRIRAAIDAQGAHGLLSKPIQIGKSEAEVAIFIVTHRVPGERIVGGHTFPYRYRFILSTDQRRLLKEDQRVALENPPEAEERYRSRSDTSYEGESVTTYNRRSNDNTTRIMGAMTPARADALATLREKLDTKDGVFQLYVPVHVDGRVVFVITFHLRDELRLHAFEVYSSFIPALAAAFRQSVLETMLAAANGTQRPAIKTLDLLCGGKRDDGRVRLIRAEGSRPYVDQFNERTR